MDSRRGAPKAQNWSQNWPACSACQSAFPPIDLVEMDPGLWNFGPTHISARLLYAPFCEWPLNSPMTILSTSQLLLVQRKGARRISRLPTVSPTRPSSLMDNGRLAFVRAHVGGKGGFGARIETFFRALLAQPRALRKPAALVSQRAEKGGACDVRSLLRHLLCAPPLAQLFDKKMACPARDVVPAFS